MITKEETSMLTKEEIERAVRAEYVIRLAEEFAVHKHMSYEQCLHEARIFANFILARDEWQQVQNYQAKLHAAQTQSGSTKLTRQKDEIARIQKLAKETGTPIVTASQQRQPSNEFKIDPFEAAPY